MAATRFLLGVLSFFSTLSHLEEVAHRPNNCSSNFNHLSHLERVLYKLANKPHRNKQYMSTTIHGNTDMNTLG
jgi:predicted ATPase